MIFIRRASASTVTLSSKERQSIVMVLYESKDQRTKMLEGKKGKTNVVSFFGSKFGNSGLRIRLIG